jgi:hypothetical protein
MKLTDWLMVVLTAVYVGLSYFGLKAIQKQIKITEDSAKAAKDAASAALLSAQTLIDGQRPFVMIETRGRKDAPEFWAVNYGQSPAQIIFSNPVPMLSTPKEEELSEKLNYGMGYDNPHSEQFNVPWIPPRGEYSLGAVDPLYLTYLGEQILAELNTSTRVLIAYSQI